MPDLYVCSLEDMPRQVRATGASHLISVLSPDSLPETPSEVRPENHLRIGCHDLVAPCAGAVLPGEEHVRRIIEFASRWARGAPMLVHCHAGVSRSSAAALLVACAQERGRERDLALRLRAAAPHAQPNARLIALGDTALGCGGALIAAVEAMGSGIWLERAPLVRFSLARRGPVSPAK